MRTRRVVAMALICVLASVGESAMASRPAELAWAKSANAICAQANARTRALPTLSVLTRQSDSPGLLRVWLSDARAQIRIGTAEISQLAELARPSGAARSIVASLIANYRQAIAVLRDQLIPALERNDLITLARLAASGEKVNANANALADELGAHVCAENPLPSGSTSSA
jgi:hypothetical protein